MSKSYKNIVRDMVTEDSFKNLEVYVSLIEEKNKVMNLTGFSGDRLWEEGIYESIILLEKSMGKVKDKKILDIGAGAGFPSVAYLIANPSNSLTIYEPILKRTKFLELVNNELKLNIEIKNIRAEDSEDEEVFDFITARAVMALKPLIEVSHKPGKIGSKYIFLKGPKADQEIIDARKIIKELSLSVDSEIINTDNRENHIVSYVKESKTPNKYPRKWRDIVK